MEFIGGRHFKDCCAEVRAFFFIRKNTLIEYIFENRRIFLLIQVINKLNIPL